MKLKPQHVPQAFSGVAPSFWYISRITRRTTSTNPFQDLSAFDFAVNMRPLLLKRDFRPQNLSLWPFCRACRWQTNMGKGQPSRSSVSFDEVEKFSSFSSEWWDPRHNPLVSMNPIRMEYIVSQLSRRPRAGFGDAPPLENLKILDVGCGGGLLAESLARLGAEVTAIDPSEQLVAAAKAHCRLDPRTRNIDFRQGCSAEQLASEQKGDKFDVACLLEVIEHIEATESVLTSLHTLIKPGGKLIVSTLNRTVKSKLVAILGAEYMLRYLPVGTHDWAKFRSPTEIKEMMKNHGFEEVSTSGMVLKSQSIPMLGSWNWGLEPKQTDINWIGTYIRK